MGILTSGKAYNSSENSIEEISPVKSPKSSAFNNIKRSSSNSIYYSDTVGEYIKDAITGALQPWRVGSKDEDKFFRVIITTQSADAARKGNINNTMGRGAHKAFYETPLVYMKHNHCVLNEEFVSNWYEIQKERNPELFD